MRNPLPQHSTNGQSHLQLELRVKFWVPAHLILQDSVLNIFYMQARLDLLEGRLKASDWINAAHLGALIAQADKMKFDSAALTTIENSSSVTETIKTTSPSCEPIGKNKKRKLSKQKSTDNLPIETLATVAAMANSNPYEQYIIQPVDSENECEQMPHGFVTQIAKEHGKLTTLKMTPKNAKYWLLAKISKLAGFGEETFSGTLVSEPTTRCDVSIGPHGIFVSTEGNQIR